MGSSLNSGTFWRPFYKGAVLYTGELQRKDLLLHNPFYGCDSIYCKKRKPTYSFFATFLDPRS